LRKPLVLPEQPHDQATQEALFKAARLHLNGVEVFNFTLKNVPPLIHGLMEAAGTTVEQVDHFVLHQANQMMLKHLAKKSGLPEAKTPIAMERYGNTSSASIPLTMADSLAESLAQPREIVMVGFGVGWSCPVVDLYPCP
jgi:3-oxoacyl-[acyl-carrier-protein] synthase-3